MDPKEEKRTIARENFHWDIGFEMCSVEEGRLKCVRESGQGIDISSGGLGLRTNHPLKKGSVLRLYLPTIAKSATLPVFSEVIWVRHADGHVDAGLRFL